MRELRKGALAPFGVVVSIKRQVLNMRTDVCALLGISSQCRFHAEITLQDEERPLEVDLHRPIIKILPPSEQEGDMPFGSIEVDLNFVDGVASGNVVCRKLCGKIAFGENTTLKWEVRGDDHNNVWYNLPVTTVFVEAFEHPASDITET